MKFSSILTSLKCLVLIILFNSTGIEGFKCEYKYNVIARGWLKYQEIPATWYDARLRCALEGAILASPTTPTFLGVLVNLMKNNWEGDYGVHKEIFTGIHATFSKGDYYTIDGLRLSEIHHNWEVSEPNNLDNDEDCIAVNNNGHFSDVKCSKPLPYFCFKSENTTEEMENCGTVPPDYKFEKRTNSCYKFHTVPRTFSRAFFTCSAENGHLAIINSEIEAIVLKNIFSEHPTNSLIGNFWKNVTYVGISDWGEHGEWRTVHGRTLNESGYATFAWTEPNNMKQLCGSLSRNGQLKDVDCNQTLTFICEKDPVFSGACSYG